MTYLLITFVVLLVINVPIGFVIGIAGAVYFITGDLIPYPVTVQRVVAQTQSIAFLAVPFFIFAGNLMNKNRYNFKTAELYCGTDQNDDRRDGSVECCTEYHDGRSLRFSGGGCLYAGAGVGTEYDQ